MFISEIQLEVRYVETDRIGIAHHSNYPIWFEAGRTDLFQKIGISLSTMEDQEIFMPLIELRCRYKRPILYEDKIIVKTKIQSATVIKTEFYYEIYKINNPVLVTAGVTIHAWTNKELKPINISKLMPPVYQSMQLHLNGFKVEEDSYQPEC